MCIEWASSWYLLNCHRKFQMVLFLMSLGNKGMKLASLEGRKWYGGGGINPSTNEGKVSLLHCIYMMLPSEFVLLSVLWWHLGVCCSWEKNNLTSIPTNNGLLGIANIQKMIVIRGSFRSFCRIHTWAQEALRLCTIIMQIFLFLLILNETYQLYYRSRELKNIKKGKWL